MSEILAGSPAGTIYGTHAAAVIYIDRKLGDAYRAWEALSAPNQKRAQLTARDYIDRNAWNEDADAFAERDAIEAFQHASYELAALIAADPDVVTVDDQGSNIARVYAGGAGVDFFSPTSAKGGSAAPFPSVVMSLIGPYLELADISLDGGTGETGSCVNPFGPCRDFDRDEPY